MWMLLTIGASALGGIILQKLKLSGGMLVGAVVAAAAVNVTTGQAYIYPGLRVLAQTLAGAYIGCLVTRNDVVQLPRLIKPFSLIITSLLCLSLCTGGLIYWMTDFDLLTCLFCASPGGLTDTPLIAMDMGANGAVVAAMQFVRMAFGLGGIPVIVLLADRAMDPDRAEEMERRAKEIQVKHGGKRKYTIRGFLPTFALALAAGIAAKKLGIPAGTLSAAMIVAASMKVSGKCPGMPGWLRRVAQVLSGCCIGSSVTRAQLVQMRQLLLPVVVLCAGYALCCVGMGTVVSKLFHFDLREGMLSLTPAGSTEMALIAADLGIESPNLTVIQICRLSCVLLIFPHIFRLVVAIFT